MRTPIRSAPHADASPAVTPRVRHLAQDHGVTLASVQGTGVGGRITTGDVWAAAGLPRAAATAQPQRFVPRAEAPARTTPIQVTSQFDSRRTVLLDVFGVNPLLDDARQLGLRNGTGPAPTLFADGDLPPFTASGVDPRQLLKVPWFARHAVAAAPNASTVLAALEQFGQDVDDPFQQYQSAGAVDYVNRMKLWLAGDRSAMNAVYDANPANADWFSYTPTVGD